jgi:hypothetical protein
MQIKGSFPNSQEPATCPYPKSYESSPYPHPISWSSILIQSSHLRLGLSSGPFPWGLSIRSLYAIPYVGPKD